MKWLRILKGLMLTLFFVASAIPLREIPTIDGPEAGNLDAPPGAFLVVDRPVGGIIAFRLSDMKEMIVRAPESGIGTAFTVSGPDSSGRIVYVENHMTEKRHLLKTIMLDGSNDTVVFARDGDALWQRVIGRHLALAVKGGRVAFLGTLEGKQMHDPQALLQIGPLEIWDVERKQPLDVNVNALDHGVYWFPDGKRLAFVKFVQLDEIPARAGTTSNAEMRFGHWRSVPATFILNVDTGEKVFLHVGWSPVVSADGESVIISDFQRRYLRVHVKSGNAKSIEWPGNWGGPIALASNDRLIYSGQPTTGTPVRYTQHNSPLVGPKPMGSIKLAELGTARFRTLIPHIDPRRKLSFGVVSACNSSAIRTVPAR